MKDLADIDYANDEMEGIQKVRELAVYIPNRTSFADGFIDDILTIALDQEDEVKRSQEAPPLIFHSIFRPVDENEPLPRNDNMSKTKLAGEGQPCESKVMLGWLINTRTMRIYLPVDKAFDWKRDINNILKCIKVKHKQMETLIGRLNHCGHILPMGRYFLNRLRHLMARCEKYGKQQLQKWEKEDLQLWLQILDNASINGVSTNNITHSKVTSILVTDACEHGLGGFNVKSGKAWRYRLPRWMTSHCHINLLEFIASIIAIWLEIIEENKVDKLKHEKYLAMTDNSSAVGWLYKSNFNPKLQPGHDTAARKLAVLLMEAEASIESQHIRGVHNVVADSLSRDHHINKTHLAFILKSLFPSQAPQNLEISETLPSEITCWLESLKGSLMNTAVSTPKHFKSKVGVLFDGNDSLQGVVSVTNSLNRMMTTPKSDLSVPFLQVLGEMKMAAVTRIDSQDLQSHPPSITYVRPFGRTYGGTRL